VPSEGDESMTDNFADQLATIDSIILSNSDCHVVAAGDYNVSLSRSSVHTAMLCSYCDNAGLTPVIAVWYAVFFSA